jgi:predicted O-methyltransferase YrrM
VVSWTDRRSSPGVERAVFTDRSALGEARRRRAADQFLWRKKSCTGKTSFGTYARMNSVQKTLRLVSNLLRIAVSNPSRFQHVLGTALAASEQVADPSLDLLRFPSVRPEELLPDRALDQAVLALFPRACTSPLVLELVCLVLLLKKAGAMNVFEFGTYKGVSITQLALNVPEQGEVYTLDLPEDGAKMRFAVPDPDELQIAGEAGKGSLIPDKLKPRIHFLHQDSATLDESPYAGKMNFVFVDGAHSADYVRNDSEKAWRMLRSGGIVAWHDCRLADPDVVRYLLNSPFRPSLISNTALAFAVKG